MLITSVRLHWLTLLLSYRIWCYVLGKKLFQQDSVYCAFDNKSTLVQVMAWGRQATRHYLSLSLPKDFGIYQKHICLYFHSQCDCSDGLHIGLLWYMIGSVFIHYNSFFFYHIWSQFRSQYRYRGGCRVVACHDNLVSPHTAGSKLQDYPSWGYVLVLLYPHQRFE